MNKYFPFLFTSLFTSAIFSQTEQKDSTAREIIFAGYYINEKSDTAGGLQIEVLDHSSGEKLGTFVSDEDAFYCIRVPARASYRFLISTPVNSDIHVAVIIPPPSLAEILFLEQYINLVEDKKINEYNLVIKNMYDREMRIDLRKRVLNL